MVDVQSMSWNEWSLVTPPGTEYGVQGLEFPLRERLRHCISPKFRDRLGSHSRSPWHRCSWVHDEERAWLVLVMQNFWHSGSCWLHLPGVFSCVPLFSRFPVNGSIIGVIGFRLNSSGKKSSGMVRCISHCISWRGYRTSGDVGVDQRAISLPHPIRSYSLILHLSVLAPTGDCCLDPLFHERQCVSSALVSTQGHDPWFYRVLPSLWLSVGRVGVGEGQKTTEDNWTAGGLYDWWYIPFQLSITLCYAEDVLQVQWLS